MNDERVIVEVESPEGILYGVTIDPAIMSRIEELERERDALKEFLSAICAGTRPEVGGNYLSPTGSGFRALQALWDALFPQEGA